jgi:hypothetical protein
VNGVSLLERSIPMIQCMTDEDRSKIILKLRRLMSSEAILGKNTQEQERRIGLSCSEIDP